MTPLRTESFEIKTQADVVQVRQEVRRWVVSLGFSLVDQTKLVTAASELARNTLDHGGGGSVLMEMVTDAMRTGVRLTFADQGPGIPDIDRALTDGYTSGNGMGLGLGGSRRLVNEFEINSAVGQGTQVMICRWK